VIVNTRRLFARLLSDLRIDAVCDVGSMNGAEALTFSLAAPQSTVYAFEPNPRNFQWMQAHCLSPQRNIQLSPLAVSDHDGEAEFFLVETDYRGSEPLCGMGSLYRRTEPHSPTQTVNVRTTRLDTFLERRCPPDARLALWIDAEGKAYEVIEGLGERAENVQVIHVEVETTHCINAEQKLYPTIRTQLRRLGFTEVATDLARDRAQFNAVFARVDRSASGYGQLAACLLGARIRYLMVRSAVWICPACVRRYLLFRRRALQAHATIS
jgi:FkbM family methyltransferase